MKLLLYCTKAKPILRDYRGKAIYNRFVISPTDRPFTSDDTQPILNGKIVAECDFEVEDLRIVEDDPLGGYWYETKTLSENEILEKSCLTSDELFDYLGEDNEGYAIHIKNLHIFDEPRDLSDYTTRKPQTYDSIICDSCNNFGFDCKKCSSFYDYQQVMKAPQNMMKVCEWDVEDKILISIRPQWLCKILNDEKTIEVRKKILKEMIK